MIAYFKDKIEKLKALPLDQRASEPQIHVGYAISAIAVIAYILSLFYFLSTFDENNFHYDEKLQKCVWDCIVTPDNVFFIYGFAIALIALLIYLFLYYQLDEFNQIIENSQKEYKNQIVKEKEEKIKEELLKYDNRIKCLNAEYGQYDKKIDIRKDISLDGCIVAYGGAKKILICDKLYSFEDIIGCRIDDNQQIKHGEISSTTSTNNGNMIGRAVVGGVLAGDAGAVIGGSTAKKNTITTQANDTIIHDYTILINTKNLSNPLIRLNVGADGKIANEIYALINAIIA